MTETSSYIQQLIADFRDIQNYAIDFFKARALTLESFSQSDYIPEFKSMGAVSLEELFHISEEELPHHKHINNNDLALLFTSLLELLNSYHFICDFPNLMNEREKYDLLRNNWKKKQKLALSGESHIEFCFSDTEDCNFKGKCSICDDLQDDD